MDVEDKIKAFFFVVIGIFIIVVVYFNVKCAINYWDTPYMEIPYKCRVLMK